MFFSSICGFDNALAFRNVDDKHIDGIEKFIRENHTLLPELKSAHFKLETFGSTQTAKLDKFRFEDGDRLLVLELVTHVNCIFKEIGFNAALQRFGSNQNNLKVESNKPLLVENAVVKEKEHHFPTLSHYFLKKLLEAADRNSIRKKGGYRYDPEIKLFASYLRLIVGPLAYETLQRNLEAAIPSLTSVNRYIRASKCHITEGILRCGELLIYLQKRNLPLMVSIEEDGTKVTDRVQYGSTQNQLIGFTLPLCKKSGLPVPFSYPARNANEILGHFSNENAVSSNIIVIMAQPIANAPPFPLCIFGTDNRYNAQDVSNRWKHISNELNKKGIRVLTMSSDSDPKYNSAMRNLSKIGTKSNYGWFSCVIENDGPFYVQDTIHIATKMRNFLLRFSYNKHVLPLGKYFITLDHLHFVRENFSKDQHELTITTLNPIDRQNFQSARKMFDVKVLKLLKKHVKNSDATVQYLKIMRDVVEAYMDRNLTPLQRIRKIWVSLFLVRIWYSFIVSKPEYTLRNNFLTNNCYSCIEINAHSLILIILYLRKIEKPQLFMPFLFHSQGCESTFRQLRSMSSTFSTVTNCTVKEAIARISKIQLQNEIMHTTSSNFVYPRLNKTSNVDSKIIHQLPSPLDIFNEIVLCQKIANETATKLGLISSTKPRPMFCRIKPYTPKCIKITQQMKSLSINKKTAPKMPDSRNIQLKDYSGKLKNIDERSPYVLLDSVKEKKVIVRKTSLCWLLRHESRKLSSDRLVRVRSDTKKNPNKNKHAMPIYKYSIQCKKPKTKSIKKNKQNNFVVG